MSGSLLMPEIGILDENNSCIFDMKVERCEIKIEKKQGFSQSIASE